MIFEQYGDILVFLFGIILLFIAIRLFLTPVKLLLRFIINGITGVVGLFLINFIGSGINFYIAINAVTAGVCAVLGLPGLVLLIAVQWMGV